MAQLTTRQELDKLANDSLDNGINGKPIIKMVNGWEVFYGANGRRTARFTITYPIAPVNWINIFEAENQPTDKKTKCYRTKGYEETLPSGVFTMQPESVSCSWRDNSGFSDDIWFVDCPHTFLNETTTGQHYGILTTINGKVKPASVIVKWVVSGY